MNQKSALLNCANSTLYDLDDVIDMLEYLEHTGSNDLEIIEKTQIMLVKKLILIREIDPQISKLQGTPLKALCKTIAYKRRNGIGLDGLGKYKDKELANMATDYLVSIEGELIEYMEQKDGFFSKSDCPILK
jgi:hypothetical protein